MASEKKTAEEAAPNVSVTQLFVCLFVLTNDGSTTGCTKHEKSRCINLYISISHFILCSFI